MLYVTVVTYVQRASEFLKREKVGRYKLAGLGKYKHV